MSDELYHYGVRGMKWGQRRSGKSFSDRRTAHREAQQQKFEQNFSKSGDYRMKNISDAELRSKINRLQMEKQYKDLSANSATKTGRKVVGDLFVTPLKNATAQQISLYAAGAVGLAIATQLSKSGKLSKAIPTPDQAAKAMKVLREMGPRG